MTALDPATPPSVIRQLAAIWTADPFAVSILADCAANPPKCVERRHPYAYTADTWAEYVGKRASMLDAIREHYGMRKVEAIDRGEDVSFHDGSWPTVTEAIDAAVEAALADLGGAGRDGFGGSGAMSGIEPLVGKERIAARAKALSKALDTLPRIAARLAAGEQFNAYDSALNDDDADDADCIMHICLGPISDTYHITSVKGRALGDLIAAALTHTAASARALGTRTSNGDAA